jgi:hypothetical protein
MSVAAHHEIYGHDLCNTLNVSNIEWKNYWFYETLAHMDASLPEARILLCVQKPTEKYKYR